MLPPASALADTTTYADLQAGMGYSANPLLQISDDTGSAFGRLSAYLFHGWSTERSTTNLSAYLENSTYFRRYSNKQAFDLSASTNQRVSEKLRLFGDLGFSGDVDGQLSSRFYGVPAGSIVVDPAAPDSLLIIDPALFALSQRQYILSGHAGASATFSPRDTGTASLGAQHVFLGGDRDDLEYTQYDGSLAYDRQINERVTVGGRLIAQYSDYNSGESTTYLGPQATIRAQLSSRWDLTASAGFVRVKQDAILGSDHSSIDPAVDASLCRNVEAERICARASRGTQSSIVGGAATTTSGGLEFYRRLSAKDTIQASGSIDRIKRDLRILEEDRNSSFYSVAGSYDRLISDRFSAGVNLSARKLTIFGPNPKADVGGSIFVRYRIGDAQ